MTHTKWHTHVTIMWPAPIFLFFFLNSHINLRKAEPSDNLIHNECKVQLLPSSLKTGQNGIPTEGKRTSYSMHQQGMCQRHRRDKHTMHVDRWLQLSSPKHIKAEREGVQPTAVTDRWTKSEEHSVEMAFFKVVFSKWGTALFRQRCPLHLCMPPSHWTSERSAGTSMERYWGRSVGFHTSASLSGTS